MGRLLECSIRATLAALATAAVIPLMRARTAAARHAAWTGVVLLMLVLPAWTAWEPKVALHVLTAPAPTPASTGPSAAGLEMIALPVANEAAIPSSAPINGRQGFTWSWWNFALAIYAMGAWWLLIRLAIGTIGAHRIQRRAVETAERFLTSDFCVAPVNIGWLLPVIMLPQGWREWTRGRLDAVLARERAHVWRRDPLMQWLALCRGGMRRRGTAPWSRSRGVRGVSARHGAFGEAGESPCACPGYDDARALACRGGSCGCRHYQR